MTLKLEAQILANRFSLRAGVVERWMAANSLASITDLMRRYPGKEHAEAMDLALDEIWNFGMAS